MARRRAKNYRQFTTELEFQADITKHANTSKSVTSILRVLVLSGAVVACVAFVMHSLEIMAADLAGKQTAATFLVSILANIKFSTMIAWGAGAGGVGYGLVERRLRKRNIERLSGRIQGLERQLHPDRQSSSITSTGETNEEDKW